MKTFLAKMLLIAVLGCGLIVIPLTHQASAQPAGTSTTGAGATLAPGTTGAAPATTDTTTTTTTDQGARGNYGWLGLLGLLGLAGMRRRSGYEDTTRTSVRT